jgi:hypothetical protein
MCRCFAAGTLVLTDDGLRAIETIEVGDVVASRNEATGELTWQPVQEVYVNLHRDVIEMSFGSSAKDVETLVVTHEHPFHTRDGRWVPAGELQIGDEVMTRDGSWLALQQVVDIPDNVSTHNFMVADDHNYFVGRSGLWVHNCCIGFTPDTVASAFQGMRSGGGHAMRHLIEEGLIPNSGSLSARAGMFERMISPILVGPAKTFDWKLGGTQSRAFVGQSDGRPVVVFVAKEGPYQGRVLSAIVPDSNQIAQWGL